MRNNQAISYSYDEEKEMIQPINTEELHTTLPMADLIGLFENEISEIVNYDSFEYEHSKKAIHIFRGSPKLHKCRYKISGSKMELGQITLTRNNPFKEDEMIVVERALGALSIHLNNAVDYQAGLNEEDITNLKVEAELSYIE